MNPLLQLIKKNPFSAILSSLAAVCVLWFLLAPGNFKAVLGKNPVVVEMIKEQKLADQKSKIMTISYYYPNFAYFADIVMGNQQPKKEWMQGYFFGKPYIFHDYYQKTVDLFPEIDAPHFLLGFCEYYRGNTDIARAQFEKTVELNPYFFWSYYNLGVIYYQQGDFYKSAEILNKALTLRKDITLAVLRQSPFYQQIWRYIANPPEILGGHLNQGEVDAIILITACCIKAKGFDQALQIIRSIGQSSGLHQELWEQLRQKALNRQSQIDDLELLIQEQIPVRLF